MSYRINLDMWWMLLATAWIFNMTLFPNSLLICIPIIGVLHALANGVTIHKE